MKYIFLIIGLILMCAKANAVTVNPASNVTADSDNTAGTIVLRDGAGNFKTQGVSFSGPIDLATLTIAQLLATVPGISDTYYCGNCSPPKIVVATGTAAGNFADAVGGQFK